MMTKKYFQKIHFCVPEYYYYVVEKNTERCHDDEDDMKIKKLCTENVLLNRQKPSLKNEGWKKNS